MIESILQDLQYGARTLLRTPGITAVAILSSTFGIGANAIFTQVDHVLLSPLPVRQPQQFVYFDEVQPYLNLKEFRRRNHIFANLAGTASLEGVTFNGSDNPGNSLTGRMVSGNHFQVLGVSPLLGRALTDFDDTAPGANPVVKFAGETLCCCISERAATSR